MTRNKLWDNFKYFLILLIAFSMFTQKRANGNPIKDFPVKVETTLKENVSNQKVITAHVRITNTSKTLQNIGLDFACGYHGLRSFISNNSLIHISSGVEGCFSIPATGFYGRDIILKPGEIYEQDVKVIYEGKGQHLRPSTFRIGIKIAGHLPIWSNPVKVSF